MKINLLLVLTSLTIIIYAGIKEEHGIIGLTKRDGGLGCLCHNLTPNDSVNVWIEGPDSVLRNSTATYKLFMTGGPAVAGGFNVASYFGVLDSTDTLTQVLFGELTHTSPNPFVNDTVYWNFYYTAPDSLLTDTIYSVANSVNRDGIPSELDKWNFGQNFAVSVFDNPVNVEKDNLQPGSFVLYQNYPNPFNPSTNIRFRIANLPDNKAGFGLVSLKVYDILGNEVVTLVSKELAPGEYEIEFSLESGISNQVSGIYFYQLKFGNYTQTKKMILLK